MKKIKVIVLSLLIAMTFAGCASDNVVEKAPALIKNNKQTEKKLRYEDWKYKGFGKELPFWIDMALDHDIVTLKKAAPEMFNATTVKILLGTGENPDQAEQTVKALVADLLAEDSDFILYDNFWVLETEKSLDMPYVALYVYYKL